MNILPPEQELFDNTIASLSQGFKEQSHSQAIGTIGLDSFGLATLIAQYDVKDSGSSSGLWLKNLESAVAIAQALFVKNNMDLFIDFSKQLIEAGAISSSKSVVLNGSDRQGYCLKCEEYFETYIQNQSSQFVYRLSPLIAYSSIEMIGYSARRITKRTFASGLSKNYFKYEDSRDTGYSGTVESSFMMMNYGYFYTKEIRYAFDSLWGAEIEV